MQSPTQNPPAPAKKLVFVTNRLANRPPDAAALAELEARFPPDHLPDQPEPFAQPAYCPIQIPAEFSGDAFKRDMFRLGVHESAHALSSLLFCGSVDLITLAGVDGGGIGHSYAHGGNGREGARVSLAGLAAERLIAGEPLGLEGFDVDIRNATNDLRDAGIHEDRIKDELQTVYRQVSRLFAEGWTHALTQAATALVNRGALDGNAFYGIISRAQRDSHAAGRPGLFKALHDVQVGAGKGTPHIDRVSFPTSPMDTLTKSMDVIARAQHRERVQALHGAIDQPGISAHEVARREVLRNRADQRGA